MYGAVKMRHARTEHGMQQICHTLGGGGAIIRVQLNSSECLPLFKCHGTYHVK
jgi:hypothetical protein